MFNIGDLELLLEFAKMFLFGLMTPKLGRIAQKNSAALTDLMPKVNKFLQKGDSQLFKREDLNNKLLM